MKRLLAAAAIAAALTYTPAAAQWVAMAQTDEAKAIWLWDYYAGVTEMYFHGRRDEPGFLGRKEASERGWLELTNAKEALHSYVCSLRYVEGWVGTVDYAMEDGAFSVQLGNTTDYDRRGFYFNSHIEKGSPLYQVIGHLNKGAKVKFSGNVAMRGSCTDNTGWLIEFVQVSPL
jgi:hypothetical protein